MVHAFKSEILREAMMLFQDQSGKTVGDGLGKRVSTTPRSNLGFPALQARRHEFVSMKDGKPFSIFRCKDHGDVVAIWVRW